MHPCRFSKISLAAPLLVLGLAACRGEDPPATAVIIDTDPAVGVIKAGTPRDVDDGFAIVAALNSPELEVIGLTVVFGNADLGRTTQVAETLVQAKGAAIGVYRGARSPILNRSRAPITPATRYMAAELSRRKLTLVALGPLANIASLVVNFPELVPEIERVVAVLGRTSGLPLPLSQDAPHPDFNYFRDPRAARLVLESGVPLVLTPPELSRSLEVTGDHLAEIRSRATPAAEYLALGARAWLELWLGRMPEARGFHPADSTAIGYLLRPDLLRCEPRGYRLLGSEDLSDDGGGGGSASEPRFRRLLELSPRFEGRPVEFCHSLEPGAEEIFLRELLDRVY